LDHIAVADAGWHALFGKEGRRMNDRDAAGSTYDSTRKPRSRRRSRLRVSNAGAEPTSPRSGQLRNGAGFEAFAASRLEEQCSDLTQRWIERIAAERGGTAMQAIPTLHLVAHIPEVLRQVAVFLRSDDERSLTNDATVVGTLGALGRLRRNQNSGAGELLDEFELLAQILDGACLEWLESAAEPPPNDAVVRVAGRLNRAPIVMGRICMDAYLDEAGPDGQRTPRASVAAPEEFADQVVHELNSSLNAACITVQLLEKRDEVRRSPVAADLAATVRRNLWHAAVVLRDVHAARHVYSMPLESTRPVPFGQALGEVIADVRQELAKRNVRLDVEEPIPPVRVDASRIKLVLSNLIRNAARYADPTRSVRWVRVHFQRPSADAWWVTVSDNGLGIPEQHHGDVFRRFFRAHAERSPGAGLGLVLAARAVQQFGGAVDFTTEVGSGSTFRFSIPDSRSTPS
jgi:signal transduction histidine kinase